MGSNISGTFATIMSILSTSIWSSVRKAAIYYFITAMFVILLCFDTYFAMPLNRFYRYHEMISEKEQEKARRSGINVNARPPYFKIFKESFLQLFNIFCIFFVTLSIFPAVHSKIEQKGEGEFLGFVPRHLFTSITCFLTFNVFAMFGSLATSFVKIVSIIINHWESYNGKLMSLLFSPDRSISSIQFSFVSCLFLSSYFATIIQLV